MTIQLPRLPQTAPNHSEFQVWWQQVVEAIEGHEEAQDELIEGLAEAVADIQTAQATATQAARELARINSYPNPTNVISAADVGSDATATIAAHTRVYPVQGTVDVADVSLTGGTVTGLAFSAQYSVYYDDTTLANVSPTYVAVPTATQHAAAQPGAAAGRHFVGVITTPADGAGGTSGTGGGPPGGGGGTVLP